MPFLEFVGSVVSAIVGAAVGGLMQLFTARKVRDVAPVYHHAPPPPSQTIITVAPGALMQYAVPLTEQARDILRLPRTGLASTSPLIVPGEGVVAPRTFVEYAMDSLLIRAASPTKCSKCGKSRHVGAFTHQRWLCLNCFEPFIRAISVGELD